MRSARRLPEPEEPPVAEPVLIQMPVDVRSVALTTLTVLAVLAALRLAQGFLIPLVIGILASYALEPAVAVMVKRRVPRALAAALVLLTVCGATGWTAYNLSDEASQVVGELPNMMRQVRQYISRAERTSGGTVSQLSRAANELEQASVATTQASQPLPGVARVEIVEPPLRVRDYFWWGSRSAAALLAQITLLVFLVFFLLASGDLFKRKLVKLAGPSLARRRIAVQVLDEINGKIARFLLGVILANTVVGIATWLVFSWIGMQHAALWGLAAGVINTVPYFGPIVVSVGAAALPFSQGNVEMALAAAAIAMVITTLEGYVLTPWLMGRATRMNAVVVFIGVLFWGWMWGVWGAVLAVPMLAVLKTIADHIEDLNPIAELLGE